MGDTIKASEQFRLDELIKKQREWLGTAIICIVIGFLILVFFLNEGTALVAEGIEIKDEALSEYNDYNLIERELHKDELDQEFDRGDNLISEGMNYIKQGIIIGLLFIFSGAVSSFIYRRTKKKTTEYKLKLIENEEKNNNGSEE